MITSSRIRIGDHVSIFPRGKSKTWCAEFRHLGEHCRQSLKTRNRKVAESRARQLESQLAQGIYQQIPSTVDIEFAVAQYLDYLTVEGRAKKTLVRYRGELQTFTEFCLRQRVKALSQITPALFDRYRAQRIQTHHPKTVYHESVVIKQFLEWCSTRHLLHVNPLKKCRLVKPHSEPRYAPTLEEVQQILNRLSGHGQVLVATLAFTGMRSGELRQLRSQDVDLDQGWMRVVHRMDAPTKTRQSRTIPIPGVLLPQLRQTGKSSGPWFFTAPPSRKYPRGDHWINTKRLNERFIATAKQLELPTGRDALGLTLHSLRHFFETHCVHAGIPQRVIDAWMGHSAGKSMAAVYYHLSDEDSRRFMDSVSFETTLPAGTAGHQEIEDVEPA